MGIALREVGQEVGYVSAGRGERLGLARGEKAPELQKVAAVCLEGVARQTALELQVGQEVEHEVLESLRFRRDSHDSAFARARGFPRRCTAATSGRLPRDAANLEQDDRRLIGDVADLVLQVHEQPVATDAE